MFCEALTALHGYLCHPDQLAERLVLILHMMEVSIRPLLPSCETLYSKAWLHWHNEERAKTVRFTSLELNLTGLPEKSEMHESTWHCFDQHRLSLGNM